MAQLQVPVLAVEPTGQFFGNENRAMAAAGAPKGNGQIALALIGVTNEQGFEEPRQVVEKRLKPFIGGYEFPDCLIEAGKLPQVQIVMGVFQEPDVENQIRIRIFPAYRQFQSFEQFLDTLEQIREDVEIENFELFCSALFGYYSQQG